MNPYIEEALLITEDLGDATFVGAVSVFLHTGKSRESQDLDLVVAEQIPRERFLDLNYKFINEKGKERIYTPRNYKIDVFDSHALNEIPLARIIQTRATIPVGKKNKFVHAICLEGLIVAKYRAKRDQDLSDLSLIAMYCYKKIDWKLLRTFTKDDVEFRQIAETMKFYKENPI